MDYLYHFDFCAWNKKTIFQEADIEAIPMVCFLLFGKIFGVTSRCVINSR